MPIEFKDNRAIFHDDVSIEEAEPLLEWLQARPEARVDLSACNHLHTANLQVLMAAKADVSSLPLIAELRAWLEPALKFGE